MWKMREEADEVKKRGTTYERFRSRRGKAGGERDTERKINEFSREKGKEGEKEKK